MTFFQSRSFVYRIFYFEMYSLVTKIAILVNRAVLIELIVRAPCLIKTIVELLIVEADPTGISVIINKFFCLIIDLYFFHDIQYQF